MSARFLRLICTFCLILPQWLSLLPLVSSQQYGSFFTAIYLNGAPISSSQVSCSEMGQPGYCCASGQSCAWDNSGQLACCLQGTTCSGSVGAAQGQHTEQVVQQTQTVYRTASQNDCSCETTSTVPAANVLPVAPVTRTVTTSTLPTNVQTTTLTTTPVAGAAAVTNNNCPNGYSTVTKANVGAPTRVVGCYVIIDSGAQRLKVISEGRIVMIMTLGILVTLVAWAL